MDHIELALAYIQLGENVTTKKGRDAANAILETQLTYYAGKKTN